MYGTFIRAADRGGKKAMDDSHGLPASSSIWLLWAFRRLVGQVGLHELRQALLDQRGSGSLDVNPTCRRKINRILDSSILTYPTHGRVVDWLHTRDEHHCLRKVGKRCQLLQSHPGYLEHPTPWIVVLQPRSERCDGAENAG